jgi:hypothetical protein
MNITETRRFQYIEIHYVKSSPSGKTHAWDVFNRTHKYFLGSIVYMASWRQYVFAPDRDTQYSAGCLMDIVTFMKEQRP